MGEPKEKPLSQDSENRYKEIQQQTHSVFQLVNRVEKDQRRRRFKRWFAYWWYRLTFRGYKNEEREQKAAKGRVPFKGI